MSTLLFLPDFYGVIIKLLLPERSRKVNRMSKKVTWTAVTNRMIPLKWSGNKVLREKARKSSQLLRNQGKGADRTCNKAM